MREYLSGERVASSIRKPGFDHRCDPQSAPETAMTGLPWALQLALGILVVVAALHDASSRRIPNWLVVSGLLAGVGLNAFLYQWAGLKSSFFGIGLALLVYLPLYALRAAGGGDVKLMAAIGALAGPADWFWIFVATAIIGGLLAIVLMVGKGRVRKTFANVATILRDAAALRAPYASNAELDIRHPAAVTLPHAVTIAFGSFVFLFVSCIQSSR